MFLQIHHHSWLSPDFRQSHIHNHTAELQKTHILCIHASVHPVAFHNPDTRYPDHSSGLTVFRQFHTPQYKLGAPLCPVHPNAKTDLQTQNHALKAPDHPAANPNNLPHTNSLTDDSLFRHYYHPHELH